MANGNDFLKQLGAQAIGSPVVGTGNLQPDVTGGASVQQAATSAPTTRGDIPGFVNFLTQQAPQNVSQFLQDVETGGGIIGRGVQDFIGSRGPLPEAPPSPFLSRIGAITEPVAEGLGLDQPIPEAVTPPPTQRETTQPTVGPTGQTRVAEELQPSRFPEAVSVLGGEGAQGQPSVFADVPLEVLQGFNPQQLVEFADLRQRQLAGQPTVTGGVIEDKPVFGREQLAGSARAFAPSQQQLDQQRLLEAQTNLTELQGLKLEEQIKAIGPQAKIDQIEALTQNRIKGAQADKFLSEARKLEQETLNLQNKPILERLDKATELKKNQDKLAGDVATPFLEANSEKLFDKKGRPNPQGRREVLEGLAVLYSTLNLSEHANNIFALLEAEQQSQQTQQ